MKRNRALFDAVVLVVYLVAANPALTGVPVHEFIGLGAFVVMGVHIVASGDGLAGRGRAGRLALNIVLLVALAACVVSGVMVSGAALPSLGLYATGYSFWDPLHAVAAKVLLAALIVHVVVRRPRRPGGVAATRESSRRGRRLPDGQLIRACLAPRFSSLYCAAEKSTACLR